MESTATLVNIAPPTQYFFNSPEIKDAILFAHHSQPLYFVNSDLKRMEIKEASSGRVIAVWNHRELLPDTVSFPHRNEGRPINVQRWLRKIQLPDGCTGYIMDTEWGPYTWKVVGRYRYKLFTDSDADRVLATVSHKPKESSNYRALVLESIAEPVRDDIVVAYLIQRQRLLLEDKALNLSVGRERW
ncbi:hypothetical protein BJ138DRAFT_1150411 [Hygrophoropsis aurantiaca]|uniref:Uncharacterized protein n=1 Tax=Hygrophoropsis aurantiaca TaxID=72124 RepID=A0ACB8AEI5_9AGAM|nr:hypothetical protein BJ138DRAFT_1150411 [Hygrophoropsis aurantiaca]